MGQSSLSRPRETGWTCRLRHQGWQRGDNQGQRRHAHFVNGSIQPALELAREWVVRHSRTAGHPSGRHVGHGMVIQHSPRSLNPISGARVKQNGQLRGGVNRRRAEKAQGRKVPGVVTPD
jgi:hypothetical protein